MTGRRRLANRRPHITGAVNWAAPGGSWRILYSVGWAADAAAGARAREIFINAVSIEGRDAKPDSMALTLLTEAAILASLLLQHDWDAGVLAERLGREGGQAMFVAASAIGAVLRDVAARQAVDAAAMADFFAAVGSQGCTDQVRAGILGSSPSRDQESDDDGAS